MISHPRARRDIKLEKTALASGVVYVATDENILYVRCDKVTTLFRGFPAKTNEVLRQSGKSSARTAFLRLSST